MTPDMPFISMGSGKASANPLLGYLRKSSGRRSCRYCRRVHLLHTGQSSAIDMKVTGIGFRPDVFVVEPVDKAHKARKLDDAEVDEHVDFITAAEQALRGVRQALTETPNNTAEVATPPTLNK
jgi:hypothetical protein